jgi:two-component system sensor kinase FixL
LLNVTPMPTIELKAIQRHPLVLVAAGAAIGFALSFAVYAAETEATGNLAWLLGGIATGALMLLAFFILYRATMKAERQVSDQTAALRGAAERFRAVIDNAHDAIITINAKGEIETFNQAAERIFGYRPDEVLGRNVNVLMPQPYHDSHDRYIHNYVTTGVARIIGTGREVEAKRKDGVVFPIDLSVGEMKVGDHRGFIGVIRDLTARHAAERRVQELTTELVHISRLSEMGQLASSLAHELNQPLTAVANYSEAARQTLDNAGIAVPPRVTEFLEKAAAQAERAGQIMRRLRGFVEKGTVERSTEILSRVVEEASALATTGARVDGIHVILDLATQMPTIEIDKVQIQQVVVNLVRNAIEVLRESPMRILKIQTAPAGDGYQEVIIADTGPGISADIAEQLFRPFVTTKKDGMGIGLSISRSIVEGHGGKLWFEPNPDGGTIFRFTLPADGAP